MRSYLIRPQERPEQASLLELLEKREKSKPPGEDPSGSTYGSLAAGMTQLGRAIGHRMRTNRRNNLDQQIEQLDPTGDIVRALMRGRQ